jgi:hypothetical protein
MRKVEDIYCVGRKSIVVLECSQALQETFFISGFEGSQAVPAHPSEICLREGDALGSEKV